MNELDLAALVDELAQGFLDEAVGVVDWVEVFDAELTEREAELATVELHRRGLPIDVRSTDPLAPVTDRLGWLGL